MTYEKIKEMKYLEKCQKEALRMYPPTVGLFIREATKDHFLGSIPLKTGTRVTINITANHFKE